MFPLLLVDILSHLGKTPVGIAVTESDQAVIATFVDDDGFLAFFCCIDPFLLALSGVSLLFLNLGLSRRGRGDFLLRFDGNAEIG